MESFFPLFYFPLRVALSPSERVCQTDLPFFLVSFLADKEIYLIFCSSERVFIVFLVCVKPCPLNKKKKKKLYVCLYESRTSCFPD